MHCDISVFCFSRIFPIVDVKCGGFCVAESSVPVRALPPSNIHAMCGAADLVLMVVRRCRCRAPPGDPGRHLGEPSGPSGDRSSSSIWGKLTRAPPSGEGTPPPAVSALHYQPTKGLTHSTVESLWFLRMTTMKIQFFKDNRNIIFIHFIKNLMSTIVMTSSIIHYL